jgi:MATE family multidrug resistance protein
LQGVSSGVFRGCGRQKLGASINLGGYWMLGLPLSAVLAFVAHMGLEGQWIGIVVAS